MAAFSSHRRWGLVAILAMAALPYLAGDVAVLKNGFEIRHERRAVIGTVTRLYVKADKSSFVDVPTAEIDHFEAAPDLPVTAAVPAAPARAASNIASANVRVAVPNVVQNAKPRAIAFPARPVVNLNQVVNDASDRYRLDPDLVNSVIKAESDFHVRAVSPKGAQGLMQLMPGTATGLGVSNAFDPQANVDGGTKYLRELLERYNFDLVKALAAYNAGPEKVERFGGVPPYYETRTYVARIVKDFNKKKMAQQKAAGTNKRAASKNAPAKTPVTPAKPVGNSKLQASSRLQAKTGAPGEKN